jgi:tetratricopeptide (TPR) repeat protein
LPEQIDYARTCFVIMPFGPKTVGSRTVDFDPIYEGIFAPAIAATPLPSPESGYLVPKRTDKDFFSGDITVEMYQYLEYSRFALADISGLNANVFYELGARHRARESGTAIFRQPDAPLPFDISKIKAFPYEYEPDPKAAESRALITQVLQESLRYNRIDSPVQVALRIQQATERDADGLLREADKAIRNQDTATAAAKLGEAVECHPGNPLFRMRLGLLLRDMGRWPEAVEQFEAAVARSPQYAEALRELGIAQNKLCQQTQAGPDGEEALRRAIELRPTDFDALASLGGVLKRKNLLPDALAMYRQSTQVSNGHPYPLLNELKLQARVEGKLPIQERRLQLLRAERARRAQTANHPPYDVPWSFFDLAEIRLYLGAPDDFLGTIDAGLVHCNASWQPKTFRDSLQLLVDGGVDLPGLAEGLRRLDEGIEQLT